MGLRLMIVVVVLSLQGRLTAQPDPPDSAGRLQRYLRFDNPPPLSCLLTLLPPFLIQHGMALKEFVRSREFGELRRSFGDLRAVDAIYVRAMQLTNNNTGVALLLSTIGTLDHRLVGIKVPLLSIYVPLSNESQEDFDSRLRNIGVRIYSDSPSGAPGDRDKLQHFFGSAFLTFVFESRHTAERFGEFVERGEEALIIDGAFDDRDTRANRQGQEFALALLENNLRYPSEFLRFDMATDEIRGMNETKCIGVR